MFPEPGMSRPADLTEPLAPARSHRNNDASDVTVTEGGWGGRGACGRSPGGGAPDPGGRGRAPGPGVGGVRGDAGGLAAEVRKAAGEVSGPAPVVRRTSIRRPE